MKHLIIYEDPEGVMIGEYATLGDAAKDNGLKMSEIKIIAGANVPDEFAKGLERLIPERM